MFENLFSKATLSLSTQKAQLKMTGLAAVILASAFAIGIIANLVS